MEDRREDLTLDEKINNVLEQVGGNGRYQKLIFTAYCLSTMNTGFIIYNLSYLELLPQFTCNYVGQT